MRAFSCCEPEKLTDLPLQGAKLTWITCNNVGRTAHSAPYVWDYINSAGGTQLDDRP